MFRDAFACERRRNHDLHVSHVVHGNGSLMGTSSVPLAAVLTRAVLDG